MAADELLLSDGSSRLLLSDGVSVLLLSTETVVEPGADTTPYRVTYTVDHTGTYVSDHRGAYHLIDHRRAYAQDTATDYRLESRSA